MLKFELSDIKAVDLDGALLDLDDPTNGETDGTFSSTSPSNNPNFVASLDVEV